jgi:hypothetical protein
MALPDLYELARLCSLDIGKEVTSDEIRGYLFVGAKALDRFSSYDRQEIAMTIIKELDRA